MIAAAIACVALLVRAGDGGGRRATSSNRSSPAATAATRAAVTAVVSGVLPVRLHRVGGAPGALVWAAGAVWVANGRHVVRVDPSARRVAVSHARGAQCEDSQIAAGFGAVWLVSGHCRNPGELTEIDPATGRAVWHALIPEFAEGVSVWPGAHRLVVTTLARGARSVFVEVDPTTRRTRVMLGARHGPSTGGLTRLLATPAGFWAEPSGFGGVARIVPRGGHLIARVMYSYEEKSGLAYGGGIVFAGLGGDVLELDPRTGDQLGPPLHPPGGITALAYGGNSAWIGTRDGRLFRYAPGDHALALAARLPWDPTSLTVGGGYVWAASFSTGRIARIGPIPTS